MGSSTRTIAAGLECVECGGTFSLDERVIVCPSCDGILNVMCDLHRRVVVSRDSLNVQTPSLWRYREFLPIVNDDCIVSLGEGRTPMKAVTKYGTSMGLSDVNVKLDFLNPTGSFKDRGCTVSVSKMRELGVTAAMDDSSGNAGASLAAYCAAAGIECTLFVPLRAPKEKLVQADIYGANLVKVPGTRTDVARTAQEHWKHSDLYYASHNLSPFFLEGMKTLAYEICEDLNWTNPDHMVFPVGGGALMAGAWKGFKELLELGWIKHLPKVHCIQSDACAPIVEAHKLGSREIAPVKEMETVAGGIRISNPGRGRQVLESLRDSHGEAVSVNDESILRHQAEMARREGIFAEPTSCAALAGLEKLQEMSVIRASDRVIVPLTGFGLKDTEATGRRLSLQAT